MFLISITIIIRNTLHVLEEFILNGEFQQVLEFLKYITADKIMRI